ncbi:MAG TPA: RNA polymerase sigma factor [Planctomycetota bacterium]|nr:RNA polymerase sigma factor [Planctomycetota bacterium]
MTEAEASTVRAAITGDPEAFRRLVEQYHRIVLGTVYRLLSPRTPQDAEDHVQDIFVKLARAIATFDFDKQTKFSTWFYTFVRNHCFDVMKRRRIRTVPLTGKRDGEETALELPSREATPSGESQETELRVLLAHAIDDLPEPERVVFVMREIEGRPYEEIAAELDIAEGTAKGRLYRAKEELRTKLGPYLRDGTVPRVPPIAGSVT